jgi:general secretion pathway protein I
VKGHSSKGGFTLIEALVAMVIIAVMGTGLLRVSADSLNSSTYAQDRSIETIIASNYIVDLQQSGAWPESGRLSKKVDMAQRSWQVDADIHPSDYAALQLIEVRVTPADGKIAGETGSTLVGFIGKH